MFSLYKKWIGGSPSSQRTERSHLPSKDSTSSYWHQPPSAFLLHHRTTANLPEEADVVIIGSGISGTFAARRLAEEEKLNVVMLEAREACWGATGRNGGHCQPLIYSSEARVVRFELQNFDTISTLIKDEQIDCEWAEPPNGACHAYYSPDSFAKAKTTVLSLAPDLAPLASVVEDRAELAALRIPNAVGAIKQRRAAKLSPYKLVSWLLEQLLKHGRLNLQTNTAVLSLSESTTGNGRVRWLVETPRGNVIAKQVLCATNGYTAHLLPQMEGLIVPVRGEMSALKSTKEILRRPLECSYSLFGAIGQDEDDYLIQRPVSQGGELMFGGGRLLAKNEGIDVDNDDGVDEAVAEYLRSLPALMDLGDVAAGAAGAAGAAPDDSAAMNMSLEAEAEWTGIMGYSRDEVPWVGGVPGKEGLFVAAGYTGHGMPNGPLSGRHVAELIAVAARGGNWREAEKQAVSAGHIPERYIISPGRMTEALEGPAIIIRSTSAMDNTPPI
ncbi:MAG: hypothetical protein M1837_007345 [Sclerophora amabilis]|nr:MAG: hypothetical protein M1837_007345 [Sclerophora amabilis]